MSNGIVSEFEKIKATDILEFWKLLDLWNEKVKRELEILKIKARTH